MTAPGPVPDTAEAVAEVLRGQLWVTRHLWVDENDMEVSADDPVRCNYETMTSQRTPEELAALILDSGVLDAVKAEALAKAWSQGASEGLRTPQHLAYSLVNPYLAADLSPPDDTRGGGS